MEVQHSFPQKQTQPQTGVNVLDKALCLSITFRALGTTRKVSNDLVDLRGADATLINVTKKLFKSKAYKAIKTHYHKLKTQLNRGGRSIPFPLKEGVFLIPTSNMEEALNIVTESKEQLPPLVNDFIDNDYDNVIGEAREGLGPLFIAEQYPSKEVARHAFAIETHWLSFSTPEKLKEISVSTYQKEFDRIKWEIEAAAVSIQNDVRLKMADLVSHMIEKLQLNEDGKPKRFKAASLNNLKEFLDGFKHINITDDKDLEKLVSDAQKLTEGVSTDVIKTNDSVREKITEGLEALKSNLDKMIEDIPSRKFKMISLSGNEETV